MTIKKSTIAFSALAAVLLSGPGVQAENSGKGFGPVKELSLGEINKEFAQKGKDIFTAKCSACHKMDERYVGPELGGVFKRRQPEWIANMILNPAEMLEKDPVAKELLGEFMVPMPFQSVSEDDTKMIVQYFRYYSEKGELAAAAKAPSKKKK